MNDKVLRRIMLVEDDLDIATVAQMALEEIGGFEVVHRASGAAALACVENIQPDLIILDFSMPDLNGGEVLQMLRANPKTARIPAIFMTASAMPAHVAKLKALGALNIFRKPFDPLTLSDEVLKTWAQARR